MPATVEAFFRSAWYLLENTVFTQQPFQAMYYCLNQSDSLLWAMATGNVLTAVTMMLIPPIMLTRRFAAAVNRPGVRRVPFLRIMLGILIMLTGIDHLLAAINLWNGFYWVQAIVKNVTGLHGVVTVVIFFNIPYEKPEEPDYASHV